MQFRNGDHALDCGVLAFGFALIDEERNRAGRVWQIRARQNQLPTLADVQEMVASATAELKSTPDVIESYVRTMGRSRMEGAGSIEHLRVPLAEYVLGHWDSQASFLLSAAGASVSTLDGSDSDSDSGPGSDFYLR